ncbi:hypothetical protein QV08_08275 [Gallibacterium salpingitidis]|uniref:Glycosyl transferase family 1 domain-containing protein n=1 Tax=Gallibacterium salpingitidis TaxID=505341 RepID=A0AB36DZC3_9PAST|nr:MULTISPECIES: glycosyltransferase [Gallibacterium]KGQ36512.1 hypothetical protein JP35_10335 [Gallibacterium anatis]OBX06249.1 hypothetical protein QV09_12330 [Gallibacterium salpingitidis]OBX07104.1 hypothetical protein QV08_08275 [Gallibacterium salpingitidis]
MNIKKRYFFLNENIGKGLTGVESSAFLRAKLFREYLGITPVFVTFRYNNELQQNQKTFIKSGILDPNIPLLNIYDFYCEKEEPASENNNQSVMRQTDATYEVVGNTLDYRVLRNEQLSMYIKYHENSRLVSFINYFDHNKKIFKRDFYDYQGYLSKICCLEPNTGRYITESYLDRNGKTRVIIHNDVTGENVKVSRILVLNKQGMVESIFNSLDEFVYDFTKKISERYYSDELFFIVDRNKPFYCGLRQLNHPNLHIIPIIHSMQTAGIDVMKGSLNSNFQEVFADLSDSMVYPIVFTEQQKQDIETRFGVKDKLTVIPHSTHYKEPYVKFEDRNPLLLTAISRLSPEKQVDKIIDVFALINKAIPETKLDIWGYGGLDKTLQEQIDKLSLSHAIKLRGITDNPYKIFKQSGMSFLTSRCEAFALVIMESLVTGCPAASFDIKYGPSSMIKDGINGILSPLNDVETLANKAIKILKNPDLHEKMCKNAYEMGKNLHASEVAKLWGEMLKNIGI